MYPRNSLELQWKLKTQSTDSLKKKFQSQPTTRSIYNKTGLSVVRFWGRDMLRARTAKVWCRSTHSRWQVKELFYSTEKRVWLYSEKNISRKPRVEPWLSARSSVDTRAEVVELVSRLSIVRMITVAKLIGYMQYAYKGSMQLLVVGSSIQSPTFLMVKKSYGRDWCIKTKGRFRKN